jgi:hypothetical protein
VFDNYTLFVNAKCFNSLKMADLIVEEPLNGGWFFTGFKTGKGVQPCKVAITRGTLMPEGIEMMLKEDPSDV